MVSVRASKHFALSLNVSSLVNRCIDVGVRFHSPSKTILGFFESKLNTVLCRRCHEKRNMLSTSSMSLGAEALVL